MTQTSWPRSFRLTQGVSPCKIIATVTVLRPGSSREAAYPLGCKVFLESWHRPAGSGGPSSFKGCVDVRMLNATAGHSSV